MTMTRHVPGTRSFRSYDRQTLPRFTCWIKAVRYIEQRGAAELVLMLAGEEGEDDGYPVSLDEEGVWRIFPNGSRHRLQKHH